MRSVGWTRRPDCVSLKHLSRSGLVPLNLLGVAELGPSNLIPFSPLCCPVPITGGFMNMTDLDVPRVVSTLLSYGPRFCVPAAIGLMDVMETAYYIHDGFLACGKNPEIYLQECMSQVREEYVRVINPSHRSGEFGAQYMDRLLGSMLDETLSFLKANPGVILVQSDKGKKVILMSKVQYARKMQYWIGACIAKGYYQPYLGGDFAVEQARIHQEFCVLSKRLNAVYKSAPVERKPFPRALSKLLQSLQVNGGVRLPYLYGLLKDHKPDVPCRPICGTRSWYTFPLQKVVVQCLQPVFRDKLLPQNVRRMEDVILELSTIPMCDGYEFVKFDVVDMYTRMSRARIYGCLDMLVHSDTYMHNCMVGPGLLLSCVRFCFEVANFCSYEDDVYRQVRGLPQGACDSGLLATLLLDFQLQQHKETLFDDNGVIYFWKYMDDVLVYIPTDSIERFKYQFERMTHLDLTIEREEDKGDRRTISFLDLLIHRTSSAISFSVYHKPMSSMRMIHFLSRDRFTWKKATLKAYIDRIVVRTSNQYLYADFCELECQFRENMYPRFLVAMMYFELLQQPCMEVKYVGRDSLCDRMTIVIEFLDRYRDIYLCLNDETINWYKKVSRRKLRTHLIRKERRMSQQALRNSPLSVGVEAHSQLEGNVVDRMVVYNSSIRYCCEELVGVVSKLFREHSLGVPVYTKAETLFFRLNMSLAGRSAQSSDAVLPINGPSRVSVYMLGCGDCSMLFLFSGTGSSVDMFDNAMSDPESMPSRHQQVYGHRVQSRMRQLPTVGWMSTEIRMVLYRSIYEALGVQCEMDHVVSHIPVYLQRTMEICLQRLKPVGEVKNVGVPVLCRKSVPNVEDQRSRNVE